METVFSSVQVLPSYGSKCATVRWTVAPHILRDAIFTVQKSMDGVTWESLNPTGTRSITHFTDEKFVVRNRQDQVTYRVIAQYGGRRYDSSPTGTFDTLKPSEYGLIRAIMKDENLQAYAVDGVPLSIVKPLRKGEKCVCIDHATGQKVGSSQCTECYGVGIVGGYTYGIRSHGRIMNHKQRNQRYVEDGSGVVDDEMYSVRIIMYPDLQKEDILINTATDDRYQVTAPVDIFRFKSVIPVVANVSAILLPRADIRYRIPLDPP